MIRYATSVKVTAATITAAMNVWSVNAARIRRFAARLVRMAVTTAAVRIATVTVTVPNAATSLRTVVMATPVAAARNVVIVMTVVMTTVANPAANVTVTVAMTASKDAMSVPGATAHARTATAYKASFYHSFH